MSKGSGTTLTLKEVEKRIKKKHGEKIKMSGYTFVSKHAHFTCLTCDYEWDARPIQVYQDSGCPRCSNRVKYTRQEIILKIEGLGGKLLSKGNVNTYEKMKIMYSCGHIKDVLFNDFLRHGCKCTVVERRKKTRESNTDDLILNLTRKLKLELISIERNSYEILVEYKCRNGHHVLESFSALKSCLSCEQCSREKYPVTDNDVNYLFRKGRTRLMSGIRSAYINQWKRESIIYCEKKCVITGNDFDEVHHLYSFTKIVDSVLDKYGVKKNSNFSNISKSTKKKIVEDILYLHEKYPLGVCLTEDMHKLFHKTYGIRNFTPENFYEFYSTMKKEVN